MRNKIEKVAYIAGRMGIPVALAKDFDKFRELGGDARQLPKVAKEMYRYYLRLWNELFPMERPVVAKKTRVNGTRLVINDVIFSGPATIVLWSDGSKTIVKAQNGEAVDPEKGLAMAIIKKLAGDRGNYYEVFKTFCADKYEEVCEECNCEKPEVKEEIKVEDKKDSTDEIKEIIEPCVCESENCEVPKKSKRTKAKA